MGRLAGKVALITGAGTGIGKGIAERFAEEGMQLALSGADYLANAANQYGTRNLGGYSAAKAVATALGGAAAAFEADVTNKAQVQALVADTVKRFGRIDVVVNAAGIITAAPTEDLTEEEWDAVMDVNVKGIFLVCQAVLPQLRQQGGFASIQNVASIAGKNGAAMLTHYCASKFAVVGYSESLAKEVAREGITVNCICPGIVGTKMWDLLTDKFAQAGDTPEQSYQRSIERLIPQGIAQTAEDMAELAVFLAVSPHVTGQAINVDGGAAK